MKNLHKILSILKQGCLSNASTIEIKYSKKWLTILELIYKEGYIQNYVAINKKKIIIFLRYFNEKNNIRVIKNFIKPSKIIYIKKKHLWLFQRYNGVLFLSTIKGIKPHYLCLKENLGGQILFFIG